MQTLARTSPTSSPRRCTRAGQASPYLYVIGACASHRCTASPSGHPRRMRATPQTPGHLDVVGGLDPWLGTTEPRAWRVQRPLRRACPPLSPFRPRNRVQSRVAEENVEDHILLLDGYLPGHPKITLGHVVSSGEVMLRMVFWLLQRASRPISELVGEPWSIKENRRGEVCD